MAQIKCLFQFNEKNYRVFLQKADPGESWLACLQREVSQRFSAADTRNLLSKDHVFEVYDEDFDEYVIVDGLTELKDLSKLRCRESDVSKEKSSAKKTDQHKPKESKEAVGSTVCSAKSLVADDVAKHIVENPAIFHEKDPWETDLKLFTAITENYHLFVGSQGDTRNVWNRIAKLAQLHLDGNQCRKRFNHYVDQYVALLEEKKGKNCTDILAEWELFNTFHFQLDPVLRSTYPAYADLEKKKIAFDLKTIEAQKLVVDTVIELQAHKYSRENFWVAVEKAVKPMYPHLTKSYLKIVLNSLKDNYTRLLENLTPLHEAQEEWSLFCEFHSNINFEVVFKRKVVERVQSATLAWRAAFMYSTGLTANHENPTNRSVKKKQKSRTSSEESVSSRSEETVPLQQEETLLGAECPMSTEPNADVASTENSMRCENEGLTAEQSNEFDSIEFKSLLVDLVLQLQGTCTFKQQEAFWNEVVRNVKVIYPQASEVDTKMSFNKLKSEYFATLRECMSLEQSAQAWPLFEKFHRVQLPLLYKNKALKELPMLLVDWHRTQESSAKSQKTQQKPVEPAVAESCSGRCANFGKKKTCPPCESIAADGVSQDVELRQSSQPENFDSAVESDSRNESGRLCSATSVDASHKLDTESCGTAPATSSECCSKSVAAASTNPTASSSCGSSLDVKLENKRLNDIRSEELKRVVVETAIALQKTDPAADKKKLMKKVRQKLLVEYPHLRRSDPRMVLDTCRQKYLHLLRSLDGYEAAVSEWPLFKEFHSELDLSRIFKKGEVIEMRAAITIWEDHFGVKESLDEDGGLLIPAALLNITNSDISSITQRHHYEPDFINTFCAAIVRHTEQFRGDVKNLDVWAKIAEDLSSWFPEGPQNIWHKYWCRSKFQKLLKDYVRYSTSPKEDITDWKYWDAFKQIDLEELKRSRTNY